VAGEREAPMSHRIPVDRGVVVYRRGTVWWFDIHRVLVANLHENSPRALMSSARCPKGAARRMNDGPHQAGRTPGGGPQSQRQFEGWRAQKRGRERIPQNLWRAAAQLCQSHSLPRVARWLRLNPTALRARIRKTSPRDPRRSPTFVVPSSRRWRGRHDSCSHPYRPQEGSPHGKSLWSRTVSTPPPGSRLPLQRRPPHSTSAPRPACHPSAPHRGVLPARQGRPWNGPS